MENTSCWVEQASMIHINKFCKIFKTSHTGYVGWSIRYNEYLRVEQSGAKDFLFFWTVETGCGVHPASYWVGTVVFCSGLKQSERHVDHLTSITHEWSYTFTSPIYFHGVDWDSFTFPFVYRTLFSFLTQYKGKNNLGDPVARSRGPHVAVHLQFVVDVRFCDVWGSTVWNQNYDCC